MPRRPLPSAIKEASGAFAKNPQRRNNNEPKAKRGWPEMPLHVQKDAVAKEAWNNICKTLDELNILTTADQNLLGLYCQTYSQWVWLSECVKDGNCSILKTNGEYVTSPEANQLHKYADRVLRILTELGLTPSSRQKVHVVNKEESDPFTEWLSGNYDS